MAYTDPMGYESTETCSFWGGSYSIFGIACMRILTCHCKESVAIAAVLGFAPKGS